MFSHDCELAATSSTSCDIPTWLLGLEPRKFCNSIQEIFLFFFLFTQAQKFEHELEEAQKENQQTKDKLQEVQTQVAQHQNQPTKTMSYEQVAWSARERLEF